MVSAGRIPYHKAGHSLRFDPDELNDWIKKVKLKQSKNKAGEINLKTTESKRRIKILSVFLYSHI